MKSEGEEKPLTYEELLQKYKEVERMWHKAELKCIAEKEDKKIWMIITLIMVCGFFYQTKSSTDWNADVTSNIISVAHSDWWGMKKRTYYPLWRKPTGVDSMEWCLKYPDGTWQAIYGNDNGSLAYSFPPEK